MTKHLEGYPPGIRFLLVLGLVSILFAACCPTGAYDDNFGRFYTLVTTPDPDPDWPFRTTGQVDTRDWGCGIWEIRPEPPLDPAIPTVQWMAVNPNPNPADQCCYAFRFDGQVAGSGCVVILGDYRNVGGKCEPEIRQMFLQQSTQ